MKILSRQQIVEADSFIIKNKPISSTNLMEHAALKITDELIKNYSKKKHFTFFCGIGNNGGDGLVIARLLHCHNYNVDVNILEFSNKSSKDFILNRKKIEELSFPISVIKSTKKLDVDKDAIIIDAIFGSGLNRPPKGNVATVIDFINQKPNFIISIDIPSGLYSDDNSLNTFESVVKSNMTYTFQSPKLSFFLPKSGKYIGDFKVLDIGLSEKYINNVNTQYFYFTEQEFAPKIKNQPKFSHKGVFGHALLIGGSKNKLGAIILSGKACLRSGVGILTIQTPSSVAFKILKELPESMLSDDIVKIDFTQNISNKLSKYSAIGIGPGLGTKLEVQNILKFLIQEINIPIVFDADALNILAENKTWLSFLPSKSILTPHPGEFKRLFGNADSGEKELRLLQRQSMKYDVIIVLKGAYTKIAFPTGQIYFNSTGNSGLSTAGSGDVLTGIITALLSQGYNSEDSALMGVFKHGKAADLAIKTQSKESLIASDIIEWLKKV